MKGKMRYVFHAHKSESEIHPRNSFVVDMFVKDSIVSLGRKYCPSDGGRQAAIR